MSDFTFTFLFHALEKEMATHFSILTWRILYGVAQSWTRLKRLSSSSSGLNGKESACNAGGPRSIPGAGDPLKKRNGYPLQFSCLENSMDRGACWATVHGVAGSGPPLSS